MIPSIFVAVDALPQTLNGKTDRQRLPPVPGTRPDMVVPYTPASTPLEEELVAIWAEVLGLDRLGIHDRLFRVGRRFADGDAPHLPHQTLSRCRAASHGAVRPPDDRRDRRSHRRDPNPPLIAPLQLSRHSMQGNGTLKPRVRDKGRLGPGLVFFFTAMGPGTFLTSAVAGATYGYSLIWALGAGARVSLRLGQHGRVVCLGDAGEPAARLCAYWPLARLDRARRNHRRSPLEQSLHDRADGECGAPADAAANSCERRRSGRSC